jgi:hypothetical protein
MKLDSGGSNSPNDFAQKRCWGLGIGSHAETGERA